jgi:hypothetical protein
MQKEYEIMAITEVIKETFQFMYIITPSSAEE